MKCPKCGVKGSKSTEGAFAARGEVEGAPIRECQQCGAWFTFGLFGRTKEIPEPIRSKMEAEWDRTSPVSVAMFDEQTNTLSLPYRLKNYKLLNDQSLNKLASELRATEDESALRRIEEEVERRRSGAYDIEELRKNLPNMEGEVLAELEERARASDAPNRDAALELFRAERLRRQ